MDRHPALSADANVEPPLVVEMADQIDWSDTADVVVVGFGGAGAASAIQAAEEGARVMAFDRFAGGGATAYSGGIYYAGGTAIQREAGYHDCPEAMEIYLAEEGTPVGQATLHRFCKESAANFDWVRGHGVSYDAALYKGKGYPPGDKFLYFSGNETSAQFRDLAKPAPRGHRAVGKGFTGYVFYGALKTAALAAGVRLVPHAPVRRLIQDAAGRVLGVEADILSPDSHQEHDRLYKIVNPYVPMSGKRAEEAIARCAMLEREAPVERRRIRALGGVILASGGFVCNQAMLRRFRPAIADASEAIMRNGSMGCDGSGIALGETVGGVPRLMESAFVGRSIAPPEVFVGGLLVNEAGERFIREDAYLANVGGAISEQTGGGTAYLIIDARTFWSSVRTSIFMGKGLFLMWGAPTLLNLLLGGTRRARSLARLARKCGLDPYGLEQTILRHNARVASRSADPLGKLPENMRRLEGDSYYAVNMSTWNKYGMTFVFTLGGLDVNEANGAVTNISGADIPGLYAAGRCAVGLCSTSYMSGMSLADGVFSGRRAGRSAAQASRMR